MLHRMNLVTLLVILNFFAASAQDMSLYQKKEFISDSSVLPYRILFPEDYNKKKKYPLILVLHGAGERGIDNEKQLIHGGKVFLDSVVRKKYPAIVVFPQCPTEGFWSSVSIDRSKTPLALEFDYKRPITKSLYQAMSLLEQLGREESVDARRIYITGLSMGGMGTFEAVYRFPDKFAAAMPICGGGDTVLHNKVKTPFWIFHGADDAVVDVKYSRSMLETLKERKVNVKYTEYPGVNHNSWNNAFSEPDFLNWMMGRKLGRR